MARRPIIRPAGTVPASVDFTSGSPYAARWILNLGNGHVYANAWQGRSVLARIQQRLGATQSGRWDDDTAQKLVSLAQTLDSSRPGQGYGELVDVLGQSQRSQTVSRVALQFAIWYAFNGSESSVGYGSVAIPNGATLYQWGVAPADDSNGPGQAFSWDPEANPGWDPSDPAAGDTPHPVISVTDNSSSDASTTSSDSSGTMTISPSDANANGGLIGPPDVPGSTPITRVLNTSSSSTSGDGGKAPSPQAAVVTATSGMARWPFVVGGIVAVVGIAAVVAHSHGQKQASREPEPRERDGEADPYRYRQPSPRAASRADERDGYGAPPAYGRPGAGPAPYQSGGYGAPPAYGRPGVRPVPQPPSQWNGYGPAPTPYGASAVRTRPGARPARPAWQPPRAADRRS